MQLGRKPCDQVQRIAMNSLFGDRDRISASPCAPLDAEAWRAGCQAEFPRDQPISSHSADPVFGFRPWRMPEQPGNRRLNCKIGRF